MIKIGVLALQGDVSEHINATREAAKSLKMRCEIVEVRTSRDLEKLDALIIPGGESTTLYKLCEREGMLEGMRRIKNIFGTCAGAIMLAKKIRGAEEGQGTLGLMDIEMDRNAYGRQSESFEEKLNTELGTGRNAVHFSGPQNDASFCRTLNAIFIRAPKIRSAGLGVKILAQRGDEIVACEERTSKAYYLATCFHPELSTGLFHAHFLKGLVWG